MEPQKQKIEQKEQEKKEEVQANQESEEVKKEPQTLSEGERMGLSKQQLRKLEKKLKADAKKKKKQEEEVERQKKGEKKQKKKGQEKEAELAPEYVEAFNSQKVPFVPNKNLPSPDKNNILVTSALPYVNNVPHLGNIIGCVLSADVYARFKRLQGDNVLYICGTDEYGTATEVKALQEKKTPKEVCDYYHAIHRDVYKWFDIGFDYFGRTSTEWHTKICQQIFIQLQKHDRISKQSMTQCYCPKCDLFLADRFVGGICPFCEYDDARGDQCDKCQKLFNSPTEMKNYFCTICKNFPELKETVHFFLDLPHIQKQLEDWVQYSSVAGKWSQNSISTTKAWTNMGLKSKCITRDLKWGVSVPVEGYSKKVFYVWYDAPIGYISITANLLGDGYKNWWQSKDVKLYQFMGKDNVPFHTVIFPSCLMSTKQDWTLLHHISTTEYLNYENGKFSKRKGTGVFGNHPPETGIPSEVWRYYLLVNRPEKSDSQFSWADFIQKNNSQLLSNLGNLCLRALKFCYSNYEKSIPKITPEDYSELEQVFLEQIKQKYDKYVDLLTRVQIKEGLKMAMEISSFGNKYLQDSKFWEVEKKKSGRTQIVNGFICRFIRLLSLIVEPYMPSASAKINFLLGLKRTEKDQKLGEWIQKNGFQQSFWHLVDQSQGLREPVPLFKQYSEQQMENWKNKFKGQQ